MAMTNVKPEPGGTIAEKLGASAGLWAVLWIALHYAILNGAAADPASPSLDYVRALLDERMRWEWATALRLMGGLMIVWFMGSLSGRLRLVEGEPGRLASISFGIGVLWGAVWVFSAMFNSVGILLATGYEHPDGARLAGVLAREMVLVLTPSIVFVLALATSFVAFRFGGFPKSYIYATGAFTMLILALAIIDWYGVGNRAESIMVLALGWLGITSALVIPTYHPSDLVRGAR
jgi:uncharacterized membrane protein